MDRVLAALLLLNASALLATDGEPVAYGAGGSSCGEWLKARKGGNYYTQAPVKLTARWVSKILRMPFCARSYRDTIRSSL